MTSQLPPREIQARIRSGETVEDVALAAQTSVEKVMVYAGPVLAERAHIAGLAQAASVRGAAGGAGALEELVEGRLRAAGASGGALEWDAWKRDDGRWQVSAELALDGVAQQALFIHDLSGRYSVADDDLARWLVGESDVRPGSGRTQAVPDPADDAGTSGLDVQDDAEIPLPPAPAEQSLRAVREGSLAPGESDGADESDASDEAPVVSGVDAPATVPAAPEPDDEGPDEHQLSLGDDAIALVTGGAGARPAAVSPAAAPAAPPAAWDERPDVPGWLSEPQPAGSDHDKAAAADPPPPASAQDVLFGDPPDQSGDDDRGRSQRKRGRASIPSWDEIMFGGPADGAPLADGEGSSGAADDDGASQA